METLQNLQRRRIQIAHQIAALGDFRPGSVTTTQGKCGKPSCCCRQPGHPGHQPHWRLTYKTEGKTRTESLANRADIQKAEKEIEEFRKFQRLSREFVEVNSKICQMRSADAVVVEEKKRQKRSRKK